MDLLCIFVESYARSQAATSLAVSRSGSGACCAPRREDAPQPGKGLGGGESDAWFATKAELKAYERGRSGGGHQGAYPEGHPEMPSRDGPYERERRPRGKGGKGCGEGRGTGAGRGTCGGLEIDHTLHPHAGSL